MSRSSEVEELPKLIPVSIKGLALDSSDSPVVLLEDPATGRVLPIWIGVFEATSIQIALDGISVERPLTHDLLIQVTETLGGEVVQVAIVALTESTYYAQIALSTVALDGSRATETLDARPSDAIAIAVRCNADILVAEAVMDQGHLAEDAEIKSAEKKLEEMGPEELGKYTM